MRATRTRSLIASVTCIAFTMLVVWPNGAGANGDKPAAAPAPPPSDDAAMGQAKQHFETGRNAYNAGDYVTAIREFKAAEALRPSPILDYNIGLANEKLGKRRVAVKYYHRYLEEQPNAANKAEVQQRVTVLEAEIAAQPPPAATAQPGGTAPQPGAAPQPGPEQASDMPPPDSNVTAQPGYDPYASQPPPGQSAAVKPAKKKSLWWIWLIIAGAVTIAIVAGVVIYVYAASTTRVYPYNHALTAEPLPRVETGPKPLTLFRF